MKSRWLVLFSRIFAAGAGALALLLLLIGTERPAQAYVDPGTGMMIWQTVAAAVLGVGFYFRKIFSWFRPRKKENKIDQPTANLSKPDQQGPAV